MAVSVHLLLLVPVLSLCGAAQYYVTPTEPANTSCPAQPCLTLNQYTNHSDRYFKSNTVFKFLPGTHFMDRPLEIKNVQNISLEAVVSSDGNDDIVYPLLVARFNCQSQTNNDCFNFGQLRVCCSVLQLINVTQAAIDSVTVKTLYVTAVTLIGCSELHIQSITAYNENYSYNDTIFGIFAYQSNDIEMDSIQASNYSHGLILYNTSNTNITDTSIVNSTSSGIVLLETETTKIINTTSASNNLNGMLLQLTNNTYIVNISLVHNGWVGMHLNRAKYTYFFDAIVANNQNVGMYLNRAEYTYFVNTTVAYNHNNGMWLVNCTTTVMTRVRVTYNEYHGIALWECNGTNMTTVYTAYNQLIGISMTSDHDTSMMTVYASRNGFHGLLLAGCTNTSMILITAVYNHNKGVYLSNCNDTSIMNTSVSYNGEEGILLFVSNRISMTVIFTVYNWQGIKISASTETNLTHVISRHNKDKGIELQVCMRTNVAYLSSTHNTKHGMLVVFSSDTQISNSVLLYNEESGMNLLNAIATYITNTASFIIASNSIIAMEDNVISRKTHSTTTSNTDDPTSLPAVITLYDSTMAIRNCTFTGNSVSSIKAFRSNVTLSGEVIFSHNRAFSGTAFILGKSVLTIGESCTVTFLSNHAAHYGGVFYLTTEESYGRSVSLPDVVDRNNDGSLISSRTECFVRVEGSRDRMRFTFVNNTAGKGGDVLHGGLVALGYDRDWNCLLSFKNISDLSEQSGLSPISSAPSRVCLCNRNGQPDCLTVASSTTHVIYPGDTINIPVVVVGQDFGTVTGTVFAQLVHTPDTVGSVNMESGQYSRSIEHSQCNSLEYTIFSQSEESEAVLVLTADDREVSHLMNEENNQEITNSWETLNTNPSYSTLASDVLNRFISPYCGINIVDIITHRASCPSPMRIQFSQEYYEANEPGNRTIDNFYKFTPYTYNFIFPKEIYSYPVYINISFRPCPPAFTLSREPPFKCDCSQLLQQLPGVKCHIQDKTITRSGLVWVGGVGNETETATNCPYNYCNTEETNMTVEDHDYQCNFNHSGVLCGGCQPGLSLALGSNQCLHCSNTHLALFLPIAVGGLALVFFIKVVDLTISQGTLNGLIFYANVVKVSEHLLFSAQDTNPLAVWIAWLNLDLGVETCFFNGLTAYMKTWLQFVFPIYIWSIAGLIIILAKYSDRVAKVAGNNSVPVLATLFFLSYARLFRTIITAMSFTMVSTTHGSKAVWSADGNLDYLGSEHASLFAVALLAFLLLWLPYTLLLFLGQWLYRCNCRLITRMLMKMKPVLDAHYGPLKSNHRYWLGAVMLMRVAILLISALVPSNHGNIVVYSSVVCALVVTCYTPFVFQRSSVSAYDAVWFVNLGILSASRLFLTTTEDGKYAIASNILVGLAFAQFLGLILFKLLAICKHRKKTLCLFERFSAQQTPQDDGWELYEEAAICREREAQRKRERKNDVVKAMRRSGSANSYSPSSVVSLPTYGF